MQPSIPHEDDEGFDVQETITNTRAKLLQAAMNSQKWDSAVQANILVVGLSGAGKSTFLEFIDRGAVVEKHRKPTLSFTRILINFGRLKMIFIDVPGQKSYWKDWVSYLSRADGVIFLVDSANFKNVSVINGLVYQMLKLHTLSIPVLFLANKQDLLAAIEAESIDRLLRLSERIRYSSIFPISALNGDGILSSLKWFAKQLNKQNRNINR